MSVTTDTITERTKRRAANLLSTLISISPIKDRVASLDLLRGLAIFLMIIVNALAAYSAIPPWLKHAPANGYTVADIVVPMFLFPIGISYELSFSKRLDSHGKWPTIRHFMIRYVILFCFGFFGELLVLRRVTWGLLTMIGTVGIYSLPFMFLRPKLRIAVAAIPFVAYQIALSLGAKTPLVDMGMGNPLSIPAWGFIVISASAIGHWLRRKDFTHMASLLGLWGMGLTVTGILLTFAIPLNKHIVSASYILFSTGVIALTMLVFSLLVDVWKLKIPLLGTVGRNALTLYILSSLLILGLNAILPVEAPLLYVVAGSVAVLGLSIIAGVILDQRKLYIRL